MRMIVGKSIIYVKILKEQITAITRIMEGYEHLALVSTIDGAAGIVMLRGTPDTYPELLEILGNMPFPVEIIESFEYGEWSKGKKYGKILE
ncbi:MAG: DUF4911 domain-containing protein [Acidaminococcaceae bacterium]